MSRKEKAEPRGAQRATDTREFPIEQLDVFIDDSKLPISVAKKDAMKQLRNENTLGRFSFLTSVRLDHKWTRIAMQF